MIGLEGTSSTSKNLLHLGKLTKQEPCVMKSASFHPTSWDELIKEGYEIDIDIETGDVSFSFPTESLQLSSKILFVGR